MTVCKDIKSFSRKHEHIADFFSLLAVALLFASVWATVEFYDFIADWLRHDALLHGAILMAVLVLDVALILGFLAVGSSRLGEDNEKCFGTFQGRRNSGTPLGAFRAWLHHMENVGKKHR